ncbi:hypothetical protein ACWIUD_08755 [Helicobacter sp. 23-1044]
MRLFIDLLFLDLCDLDCCFDLFVDSAEFGKFLLDSANRRI